MTCDVNTLMASGPQFASLTEKQLLAAIAQLLCDGAGGGGGGGSGDMLGANNLSDVANDQTSVNNLLTGQIVQGLEGLQSNKAILFGPGAVARYGFLDESSLYGFSDTSAGGPSSTDFYFETTDGAAAVGWVEGTAQTTGANIGCGYASAQRAHLTAFVDDCTVELQVALTSRVLLKPMVVDGPTAVAHLLDTSTLLADASAMLLSIRNLGTERWGVTALGTVTQTGTLSIEQGTLTAAAPAISVQSTWNNGAATFNALAIDITDTASAAQSTFCKFNLGGVEKFTVNKDGGITTLKGVAYSWPSSQGAASTYLANDGSGGLTWATVSLSGYLPLSGGTMTGNLLFSPDNTHSIGALGATRPLTIYAGTLIHCAADIRAGASGFIGLDGRTYLSSTSAGVLMMANSGATDFSRLQFGGTSASFPAIKRNGTALNVRLADDSADAAITAAGATLSGVVIGSVNGALSAPALTGTGTWITGGTATTTKPYWLIEPTGATSAAWSTAGTGLGINAASGFTGNLIDAQLNGAVRFRVSSIGSITINGNLGASLALAGTADTSPLIYGDAGAIYLRSPATSGGITIQGSGGGTAVGYPLKWTSGVSITSEDASTLQLGVDAASPIAQTFKAHDGVGTDKLGASLTTAGGQSTGSAAGGALITKTSLTGTTGSAANSYSTRSFAAAKQVDLTDSSSTLFANIALAASKHLGALLHCTVTANDGTDFQSISSQVKLDAVNKAGTVTVILAQSDNTLAASTGTLTVLYTAVVNGNGVDIKCFATSSLTQTVLRIKWDLVTLNTDDVGTVVAQ